MVTIKKEKEKKGITKNVGTKTKKSRRSTKSAKKKQELVHALGEQCFWVTDGRVLGNLVELCDALASMDDSVYMYHVTSKQNDFADWIESVLRDATLAQALRKCKKPATARKTVVSHLRIYSV